MSEEEVLAGIKFEWARIRESSPCDEGKLVCDKLLQEFDIDLARGLYCKVVQVARNFSILNLNNWRALDIQFLKPVYSKMLQGATLRNR